MKNIIIPIMSLLLLSSCANAQSDVFGRRADTGAVLGGVVGAVIGAHNGNIAKGALIGAGTGLVAGAIADANANRNIQYNNGHYTYYPSQVVVEQPPRVVYQPQVVVVETPVVIEQRVWYGNDLWVYSYHGFRSPHGHIRYGSNAPFQRRYIGGHHHRR